MGREAPHLVIAAGGTGGHMFPAQALAETMLRRGWQVTLTTDARGARYVGGFPHVVAVRQVASATFARGGVLARAAVPLRIAGGVAAELLNQRRAPPAAVVGFGGYPTIPALAAAWLLRRPRMIHEQNGVLGRVNRLFASRVDAIACGTWPTAGLPEGVRAVHTGNPVRAAVLERAGAPYIPPGDYPMSLLVIGGSQGAQALAVAVPEAVAALPEGLRGRLRVAHQVREADAPAVTDAYRSHGIAAEVAPFFRDVPRRLAEAQLVISRAGASSLAEIAVIGRPSILVPYPHATADHQSANARALVDAGAAILVPQARLTPAVLAEQIGAVLSHPEAAVKMAHAALSCGRPDAASDLADMVEALAAGARSGHEA